MRKEIMKKLTFAVFALIFVVGGAGSAFASSYDDLNDSNFWVVEGTTYTWEHDLSDNVDFSSEVIVSGTYQLDFTNDVTDWPAGFEEYVAVSFDGHTWHSLGEVDNGQHEILLTASEIDYMNNNQSLKVWLKVENDGCLDATAWIDHVRVYGNTETVPIPAAVWLLGSGLVGLLGIRTRFRRR